jgi:hypothetical protein
MRFALLSLMEGMLRVTYKFQLTTEVQTPYKMEEPDTFCPFAELFMTPTAEQFFQACDYAALLPLLPIDSLLKAWKRYLRVTLSLYRSVTS